ncbi:GSCFA domain-containing protein [Marinilabilia sp.]|uniref:GSCFA domain-containing protein n=1 Tax=Marinilabilia sp. TaxID=2021252 RepID=UPI0025C01389|nr:GSCFA domain-containing protein [Marinilabilia sp.]
MQNEFRTVVNIKRFDLSIDVGSEVLLLGSCFSDHIGARFVDSRLKAVVNPFGVVYNPWSIARLLERTMNLELCEEDELILHNEHWHHFDFHGVFSGADKTDVSKKINQTLENTHEILGRTDYLVLTFGTSYVYERVDTSGIVANCHKMPTGFFSRYRLEPDEIVALYKELIVSLRMFNPGLKILFTVSPVRHWKDGAHGNQLSKSVLFLGINKLVELFDGVEYFPAFEIVMDELRDYRFYDPGMFNPSEQAVDYIWRRLVDSLFSNDAQKFISLASKIAKARKHRIVDPAASESLTFIRKSIELIENIKLQFPQADLDSDHLYFKNLLFKVEK